jgi:hypothetical protein
MNDEIKSLRSHLGTAIWYTGFSQLTSRICHPREDIRKVLQSILHDVVTAYPAQSLWGLIGITRSQKKENGDRREKAGQILVKRNQLLSQFLTVFDIISTCDSSFLEMGSQAECCI